MADNTTAPTTAQGTPASDTQPAVPVEQEQELNNPYYEKSHLDTEAIFNMASTGLAAGLSFGKRISSEMDYYNNLNQSYAIDDHGANYGQLSSLRGQMSSIDPGQAGKGLVGEGALAGMSTGAAIGSIFPGVGTLIGGAAGGLLGAGAGLLAKDKAQDAAQVTKNKAMYDFDVAQDKFNVNAKNYYSDLTSQRQDFQTKSNYANRALSTRYSSPYQSLI